MYIILKMYRYFLDTFGEEETISLCTFAVCVASQLLVLVTSIA